MSPRSRQLSWAVCHRGICPALPFLSKVRRIEHVDLFKDAAAGIRHYAPYFRRVNGDSIQPLRRRISRRKVRNA